jgi:hypothetical protein
MKRRHDAILRLKLLLYLYSGNDTYDKYYKIRMDKNWWNS